MRAVVWHTLVGMVLLGGVILIAPSLGSAQRAEAIVAAAVICVVAGWVAMLPSILVIARHPDYLVQAGMGTMAIRLFLTLGVGFAYLHWAEPPRTTYMTAMVACYLLLLVAETGATVYLVKRFWKPPQAATN